MSDAIPTLEKQPSESLVYSMNFTSRLDATATVATIVSVVETPVTVPPLILVGGAVISGKKVNQRISGGKDGSSYIITVVITDSDGNTKEGEGRLNVVDRG